MKAKSHPDDYSTLIGLLRRQEELLSQLEELSRSQSRIISDEEDDGGRLLNILGERQEIVREAVQLGQRLAPLHDRVAETAYGCTQEALGEIRKMLDSVASIAKRVSDRDHLDHEHLRKRRDTIAAELASLGRGKQARGVYEPHVVTSEPRFHDRHG